MNTERDLQCARHWISLGLHGNTESDALLSSFYKRDQCSEKLIILIGCSKKSKSIHQTLRSRSSHFTILVPPYQPTTKDLGS